MLTMNFAACTHYIVLAPLLPVYYFILLCLSLCCPVLSRVPSIVRSTYLFMYLLYVSMCVLVSSLLWMFSHMLSSIACNMCWPACTSLRHTISSLSVFLLRCAAAIIRHFVLDIKSYQIYARVVCKQCTLNTLHISERIGRRRRSLVVAMLYFHFLAHFTLL